MRCKCGFNFAEARLDGVAFESYAAIPDDEYVEIIQSEHAMLTETDEATKLDKIGEASLRIGTIQVCPVCGVLVFTRAPKMAHNPPVAWFGELPDDTGTGNRGNSRTEH